jgi:SOS-response transcriptional repressor LexA
MDILEIRRLRLKSLVDEYGTQASLARALDVAPTYLRQMLVGERPISEKSARKFEPKLLKQPFWLDRPGADNNVSASPEMRGDVPVISDVQAGAWHEAIDLFEPGYAEDYLPCPSPHGPRTFALRVEGDSMTAPYGKSYPAGCIIYVDPDQIGGIANGDRVVAKINGDNGVTFKVFIEDAGKKFLKPLNPQYPSITESFRILGKVIGKYEPD